MWSRSSGGRCCGNPGRIYPFISGFAEGADSYVCGYCGNKRNTTPICFLEAAIPYAGRLKQKSSSMNCCGPVTGSK